MITRYDQGMNTLNETLSPNHPAVEAAVLKYLNTRRGNGVHDAIAAALTAALPHLANPADDRPWEPLNGGPVRVGDEVKRTQRGVTRAAVVGRVGLGGGLWTDEGCFIGHRDDGTWYVRRAAAPTLPTADGAS